LADKVKNEKEKEKENSKTVLRKKKIHLSNQKNRKKANMAGAIVTSGSLFSLLNSNRLSLSLPPPFSVSPQPSLSLSSATKQSIHNSRIHHFFPSLSFSVKRFRNL
jgi:hypothetical protein